MGEDMRETAVLNRVKHGYTTGARTLASRSIDGPCTHACDAERAHDRGRLAVPRGRGARLLRGPQPAALLLGSARSSSSSGRSSTSSTARSLAPAGRRRRSGRSSTRPPTGSARERCSVRSPSIFTRHGNRGRARARRLPASPARSSSVTRARRRRRSASAATSGLGSRAERVVVITAGLVLAPWASLPWAIYLLTATAWLTVLQRILFVRKQLIERR